MSVTSAGLVTDVCEYWRSVHVFAKYFAFQVLRRPVLKKGKQPGLSRGRDSARRQTERSEVRQGRFEYRHCVPVFQMQLQRAGVV